MSVFFRDCLILGVAVMATGSLLASPKPLQKSQLNQAVRLETLTIPSPGEFFAAINKYGKPGWGQLLSEQPALAANNRPQIALHLGTLVADGYIAVESRNGQQVRNLGKDIINLSKRLNVSQSILARGNSISDFAKNEDWDILKEELEATQNEVKLSMAEQKDQDLVMLVTLGAWIRGIEAASAAVTKNYQPDSAELLRQPAVIDYLNSEIQALPERTKSEPIITEVSTGLQQLRAVVDTTKKEITEEDVAKIRQISGHMIQQIASGTPEENSEVPQEGEGGAQS